VISTTAQQVKSLQLWAQLKTLVAGDRIDLQVNGQPLPEPEADGILRFDLKPDQLKVGRNEVGLRLNQRGPKAENGIQGVSTSLYQPQHVV
jgi:hypothetical protein